MHSDLKRPPLMHSTPCFVSWSCKAKRKQSMLSHACPCCCLPVQRLSVRGMVICMPAPSTRHALAGGLL
eukprot:scaffold304280_cov15-Tisochrysis_lutea.AAC.1